MRTRMNERPKELLSIMTFHPCLYKNRVLRANEFNYKYQLGSWDNGVHMFVFMFEWRATENA